jgi:tetratricopeptide (TPR) repeat protein
MKYFFLYYISRAFIGNPLIALLFVFVVYAIIDRQFIGILPDFLRPLKRWQKMSSLKKEVEINPYQAQAFYELGALHVEKGNMVEGRKYLEKAETLMPDHPDVKFYLGVTYIRTGEMEKGKEAIEEALRLNPKVKYAAPYLYLIEYSLNKGVPGDELNHYLDKIAEYGSPELYYKLGVIFSKAGYKEKAKEMFKEAQISLQGYPSFYKKQQRYWAFKAKLKSLFS